MFKIKTIKKFILTLVYWRRERLMIVHLQLIRKLKRLLMYVQKKSLVRKKHIQLFLKISKHIRIYNYLLVINTNNQLKYIYLMLHYKLMKKYNLQLVINQVNQYHLKWTHVIIVNVILRIKSLIALKIHVL